MASVDKKKPEEKTESPYYTKEAALKLTNILYDPVAVEICKQIDVQDEGLLLSLTRVNTLRECHQWASKFTQDAAMNLNRTWSLGKVYRVAFLLLSRSINMKAFMSGIGLAGVQAVAEESEDFGEDKDW